MASAATFTVNTTTDSIDAAPGNGVCRDTSGFCSLRAAGPAWKPFGIR